MQTILGIDPTLNSYPAFKACYNYRGGGYDDWFLPSLDNHLNNPYSPTYNLYNELNYIYKNSGLAGPVSEGISINDALTNLQNQGEAVQLLSSNGEPFGATWSSFEDTTTTAGFQDFSFGSQWIDGKGTMLLVRAVRAF